jgi:hypothetical protein
MDIPTGEPALVVLRDERGAEFDVGGVACPFPASAFVTGTATSLRVTRAGATVRAKIGAAAEFACEAKLDATARVSVGLRGAQMRSLVSTLQLVRSGF